MKILSREGSRVIIQRDNGEVWITRRKKPKHDSRRQKPKQRAVKYHPIKFLYNVKELLPVYDIHRCEEGHYPGLPFHP